jgi:hypothetical protein
MQCQDVYAITMGSACIAEACLADERMYDIVDKLDMGIIQRLYGMTLLMRRFKGKRKAPAE